MNQQWFGKASVMNQCINNHVVNQLLLNVSTEIQFIQSDSVKRHDSVVTDSVWTSLS